MSYNKLKPFIFRFTSLFVAVSFIVSPLMPYLAYAQGALNLPIAGQMIHTSTTFNPLLISGLRIHPDHPLEFDFLFDIGDDRLDDETFQHEAQRLIHYFFAALTTPEDKMWVNLSPYEKDRIMAEGLETTELGRDLLAQDYILKQLSASMMYPEDDFGAEFWKRVHAKALKTFGTTDIPMNTFNKIWIIPASAHVFVHDDQAFVAQSHLKVMLEEDYLSLKKYKDEESGTGDRDIPTRNSSQILSGVTSEVVREVLISEIEREVNEGKHFAPLRQMYHALILATWYKKNLKDSFLGHVYLDQNKLAGVDLADPNTKNDIYNQYLQAFEQGVFNYIKEEIDPATEEIIPRKYFSGGKDFSMLPETVIEMTRVPAELIGRASVKRPMTEVTVQANPLEETRTAGRTNAVMELSTPTTERTEFSIQPLNERLNPDILIPDQIDPVYTFDRPALHPLYQQAFDFFESVTEESTQFLQQEMSALIAHTYNTSSSTASKIDRENYFQNFTAHFRDQYPPLNDIISLLLSSLFFDTPNSQLREYILMEGYIKFLLANRFTSPHMPLLHRRAASVFQEFDPVRGTLFQSYREITETSKAELFSRFPYLTREMLEKIETGYPIPVLLGIELLMFYFRNQRIPPIDLIQRVERFLNLQGTKEEQAIKVFTEDGQFLRGRFIDFLIRKQGLTHEKIAENRNFGVNIVSAARTGNRISEKNIRHILSILLNIPENQAFTIGLERYKEWLAAVGTDQTPKSDEMDPKLRELVNKLVRNVPVIPKSSNPPLPSLETTKDAAMLDPDEMLDPEEHPLYADALDFFTLASFERFAFLLVRRNELLKQLPYETEDLNKELEEFMGISLVDFDLITLGKPAPVESVQKFLKYDRDEAVAGPGTLIHAYQFFKFTWINAPENQALLVRLKELHEHLKQVDPIRGQVLTEAAARFNFTPSDIANLLRSDNPTRIQEALAGQPVDLFLFVDLLHILQFYPDVIPAISQYFKELEEALPAPTTDSLVKEPSVSAPIAAMQAPPPLKNKPVVKPSGERDSPAQTTPSNIGPVTLEEALRVFTEEGQFFRGRFIDELMLAEKVSPKEIVAELPFNVEQVSLARNGHKISEENIKAILSFLLNVPEGEVLIEAFIKYQRWLTSMPDGFDEETYRDYHDFFSRGYIPNRGSMFKQIASFQNLKPKEIAAQLNPPRDILYIHRFHAGSEVPAPIGMQIAVIYGFGGNIPEALTTIKRNLIHYRRGNDFDFLSDEAKQNQAQQKAAVALFTSHNPYFQLYLQNRLNEQGLTQQKFIRKHRIAFDRKTVGKVFRAEQNTGQSVIQTVLSKLTGIPEDTVLTATYDDFKAWREQLEENYLETHTAIQNFFRGGNNQARGRALRIQANIRGFEKTGDLIPHLKTAHVPISPNGLKGILSSGHQARVDVAIELLNILYEGNTLRDRFAQFKEDVSALSQKSELTTDDAMQASKMGAISILLGLLLSADTDLKPAAGNDTFPANTNPNDQNIVSGLSIRMQRLKQAHQDLILNRNTTRTNADDRTFQPKQFQKEVFDIINTFHPDKLYGAQPNHQNHAELKILEKAANDLLSQTEESIHALWVDNWDKEHFLLSTQETVQNPENPQYKHNTAMDTLLLVLEKLREYLKDIDQHLHSFEEQYSPNNPDDSQPDSGNLFSLQQFADHSSADRNDAAMQTSDSFNIIPIKQSPREKSLKDLQHTLRKKITTYFNNNPESSLTIRVLLDSPIEFYTALKESDNHTEIIAHLIQFIAEHPDLSESFSILEAEDSSEDVIRVQSIAHRQKYNPSVNVENYIDYVPPVIHKALQKMIQYAGLLLQGSPMENDYLENLKDYLILALAESSPNPNDINLFEEFLKPLLKKAGEERIKESPEIVHLLEETLFLIQIYLDSPPNLRTLLDQDTLNTEHIQEKLNEDGSALVIEHTSLTQLSNTTVIMLNKNVTETQDVTGLIDRMGANDKLFHKELLVSVHILFALEALSIKPNDRNRNNPFYESTEEYELRERTFLLSIAKKYGLIPMKRFPPNSHESLVHVDFQSKKVMAQPSKGTKPPLHFKIPPVLEEAAQHLMFIAKNILLADSNELDLLAESIDEYKRLFEQGKYFALTNIAQEIQSTIKSISSHLNLKKQNQHRGSLILLQRISNLFFHIADPQFYLALQNIPRKLLIPQTLIVEQDESDPDSLTVYRNEYFTFITDEQLSDIYQESEVRFSPQVLRFAKRTEIALDLIEGIPFIKERAQESLGEFPLPDNVSTAAQAFYWSVMNSHGLIGYAKTQETSAPYSTPVHSIALDRAMLDAINEAKQELPQSETHIRARFNGIELESIDYRLNPDEIRKHFQAQIDRWAQGREYTLTGSIYNQTEHTIDFEITFHTKTAADHDLDHAMTKNREGRFTTAFPEDPQTKAEYRLKRELTRHIKTLLELPRSNPPMVRIELDSPNSDSFVQVRNVSEIPARIDTLLQYAKRQFTDLSNLHVIIKEGSSSTLLVTPKEQNESASQISAGNTSSEQNAVTPTDMGTRLKDRAKNNLVDSLRRHIRSIYLGKPFDKEVVVDIIFENDRKLSTSATITTTSSGFQPSITEAINKFLESLDNDNFTDFQNLTVRLSDKNPTHIVVTHTPRPDQAMASNPLQTESLDRDKFIQAWFSTIDTLKSNLIKQSGLSQRQFADLLSGMITTNREHAYQFLRSLGFQGNTPEEVFQSYNEELEKWIHTKRRKLGVNPDADIIAKKDQAMSNREVLFLIVYALFASQFIDSDDMMDLINSQPAPSLTAENPNPHISIADQHQNIQDILENFYTHFPRLQSQLRSDQPRIKDEDTDLLILAHDILSAEIEFQNSERKGTPDASFEDLRKLHQSIQNMLNLIQSGDNLVYSLVTNSEIFIRNWQQRRLTPERRQLAQQFKEFAPLTRQRILRETASNQTPDAAISEEVGGIDLNQNYMEMEESGEKASFNIPVHLQHIQPQSVIGIIPVIKHIAPIPSLYPLLGLVDPRTGEEPKQLYSKDPEPFEQLTAL